MAKRGPKSKLTSADSAQIRSMIERNMSDAQIAQAFGVSRQTVNRLRHHILSEEQRKQPVTPLEILRQIGKDKQRALGAHWAEYGDSCPAAETIDDGSTLCQHETGIIAREREALEAFRAEFRQ
jgi:hypothetical protein